MTTANEPEPDGAHADADDLETRELARFRDLVRRVREKDPDAQTEFVNSYWNAFKRRVRVHFTDSWMRRHFDESDVVLTLMRRVLQTLSVNDGYQVDSPEQMFQFCLAHARQRYLDKVREVMGRQIHKVTVKFGGAVATGDEFSLAIGDATLSHTASTPVMADAVNGLVALCQQPDSPREFARIQWKATDSTIEAKGRPGARFSITAQTTSDICWITTINPIDTPRARGDAGLDIAPSGSDPALDSESDEFLARIRQLLPREQRYLWDERRAGTDWQEICERTGEDPAKWRQVSRRFRTALKEVVAQMGFTEDLEWIEDDDGEEE